MVPPTFMFLSVSPALGSSLSLALCYRSFMLLYVPKLYSPQALYSLGSVFPQLYVPPLHVPAALCSFMFPQLYGPAAYVTLCS